MTTDIIAMINQSGAADGDLVYVRSAAGISLDGARLTTAPDLLGLKLEALRSTKPLVAVGPATDETYADVVIDADQDPPAWIKRHGAERASATAPNAMSNGEPQSL